MLNWFYDTPIVRAVLGLNKHPIIKTKNNFAKREEQKRTRARLKRNRKRKLLKKNKRK